VGDGGRLLGWLAEGRECQQLNTEREINLLRDIPAITTRVKRDATRQLTGYVLVLGTIGRGSRGRRMAHGTLQPHLLLLLLQLHLHVMLHLRRKVLGCR
jgi:hypothetical protein